MSLDNTAVAYDNKTGAVEIYVLPKGHDIAQVIEGKSIIKQIGFTAGQQVDSIKGDPVESTDSGAHNVPIRFVKNEILLKFHLGTTKEEIEGVLKKYNLNPVDNKSLSKIGYIKAKISDGRTIAEVKKELKDEYSLKLSEPNYVLNVLSTSATDPLAKDQWYIPEIGFDLAWEQIKNRQTVKVAVVDSGVDAGHPDLAGKILAGYDFVNSKEEVKDDNGHGTFVAGIIAASTDTIGIRGLYDAASIIPVKVIDENGFGTYEDAGLGIIFAADNGAQVINLSIGAYCYSFMLEDAVDYALAKGCVIAAAGGNDGFEQEMFPAAYPDVIGVSALGPDRLIWERSNKGYYIDVCAPGVNIISTVLNGEYGYASGTSAATPMVSALAAMLMSERQGLSASFVKRLIEQSAVDLGEQGKDYIYGNGEIDAASALIQEMEPFHDVAVDDIDLDNNAIKENRPLYICAKISNRGTYPSEQVQMKVFINGVSFTQKTASIENKDEVVFKYPIKSTDDLTIRIELTADGDIHPDNNIRKKSFTVAYDPDTQLWILYAQSTHTWIAGEAFYEWPNDTNHEMDDYIGSRSGGEYQTTYRIIKGAYDEDDALANPFADTMPYLRHFWDRGHLDDATPLQGGLFHTYDSAINRAYKYWTGGYGWDGTYDIYWSLGYGVKDKGVIQLYKDGNLNPTTIFNVIYS